MDIKISGLSQEIMAEALEQARDGRLEILDSMLATISEPRGNLSRFAPRMLMVSIDPEKIGAIIGKGGETIRSLEKDYEVSIDIQEDGTVFVAGVDGEKAEAAVATIETLATGAQLGKTYLGKVVRITDFGAFIEILPGVDGMVHISQISPDHLKRVEDALQMGDEVLTMVTDVTGEGKVRLSRRAVLEGWSLEEALANDRPSSSSGGNRGGRGGNRGGGRGGNNRSDRR
jgi:polyribonucleotide nucleotidyltransferase